MAGKYTTCDSIVLAIASILCLTCGTSNAIKNTVRRQLSEGPVTISREDAIALKPAFHITGVSGWINDPGGMFEYQGYLHIFPQAHPQAPIWAAPDWDHLVSRDRVHYQRVRPACVADTEYDVNGCWTGSCFIVEDGTPRCWYTAASGLATLGYNKQQIAMLAPLNASDPLLRYWIKPGQNPLPAPLPDGVSASQWRDPHSPWKVGNKWFTMIGGALDCAGAQMLYSTTNLTNANFTFEGLLADQASIGSFNGTCPLESTPNSAGSYCNQFGAVCQVWECPDYFNLDNEIYLVKYSDQSNFRAQFAQDLYVLSDVAPDFESIAAKNSSAGDALYINTLQGRRSPARLLDFGSVYASKTWRDAEGRRLNLGWVYETATGCDLQCSAGTNFTDTLGYQGSHHLIREVAYNNATQTLRQLPLPEYANLIEGAPLFSGPVSFDNVSAVASADIKIVNLVRDDRVLQSDLQVNFTIKANAPSVTTFRVGAVITFNSPSHVVTYISGTITNGSVTRAAAFFDTTNMTDTKTNTTTMGAEIPLPLGGVSPDSLEFRLNTDRSHLEVYALGGLQVGSTKIYPNNISRGNWTMSILGTSTDSLQTSATAVLNHWHSCWIEDATAKIPVLSARFGARSFADDISEVFQHNLSG